MNINSKKILGAILFPLLFISHLFSSDLKQVEENIKKNSLFEAVFDFKKGDYVVGEYSLSSNVDYINLLNSKNELIRKLNPDDYLKDEFFFVVEDDTKLKVKIKNLDKQNKISIKINKIIPLEEQIIPKKEFLSKKIEEVYYEIQKGNDTKKFWNYVKKVGTPLVEKKSEEEYILTYLYKGAKNNVKILGSPVSKHIEMAKLNNSDIWYKSFKVPKGTILSYQIAPDVPTFDGTPREKKIAIISKLQVDPLNKTPLERTKNFDKYNKVSTVIFDDNKYKYWSKKSKYNFFDKKEYSFKSSILNNTRKITIYKPKEYQENRVYPLLVFFDGEPYQNSIDSISILNNLQKESKIPQVVAVFINNPSAKARALELSGNKNFAKFMAEEFYPFIKEKTQMKFESKETTLIGSSYGGLASSYVAFKYPNIFGKVLSLSGSYWWMGKERDTSEWLTKKFIKSKKLPIEFFLAAGKFEIGENDSTKDILSTNRNLKNVLLSKGYKVEYEEFPSGHDSLAWEYLLPFGLEKIFKK